jgi:hypothetical protein
MARAKSHSRQDRSPVNELPRAGRRRRSNCGRECHRLADYRRIRAGSQRDGRGVSDRLRHGVRIRRRIRRIVAIRCRDGVQARSRGQRSDQGLRVIELTRTGDVRGSEDGAERETLPQPAPDPRSTATGRTWLPVQFYWPSPAGSGDNGRRRRATDPDTMFLPCGGGVTSNLTVSLYSDDHVSFDGVGICVDIG